MFKFFNSIYQFFFERWTCEVIETGKDRFKRAKTTQEHWVTSMNIKFSVIDSLFNPDSNIPKEDGYIHYTREWVKYRYINKYTGSVKIKKVYID